MIFRWIAERSAEASATAWDNWRKACNILPQSKGRLSGAKHHVKQWLDLGLAVFWTHPKS